MGNDNTKKAMHRMRLTFVSLMYDLRTITPWLAGAYWLAVILFVGYWAFSTASG